MSRSFKQTLAALLLVVCMLALAACSGGGNTPASTPTPAPTPTPATDSHVIEHDDFTVSMPTNFIKQSQNVKVSGYTIPADVYISTNTDILYIVLYADYSEMCRQLAEENNIDLATLVNTVRKSSIGGMIQGMGLFVTGTEYDGTMGNVEAVLYPVTEYNDAPAKGLAGGFMNSQGKSLAVIYAAPEGEYSESIQKTLFDSVNWKGEK